MPTWKKRFVCCGCCLIGAGLLFVTQAVYAQFKLGKTSFEELPYKLGMTEEEAKRVTTAPFDIQHCPPDDVPGRSFPSYCYQVFNDSAYVGGINFANNGPLSDIYLQIANINDREAWAYTKALVDALDRLTEAGDGEIVVKLDRKPLHLPTNRHVKFSSGQRSVEITVIGIDPNHRRVILEERLSTGQ